MANPAPVFSLPPLLFVPTGTPGLVGVGASVLSAVDPAPASPTLTYTVAANWFRVGGSFVTSFTQAQVNANVVFFDTTNLGEGQRIALDLSDGTNVVKAAFVAVVNPFPTAPTLPVSFAYDFGKTGQANNLNGTNGNDFLVGAGQADNINANEGHNWAFAFGGNDNLTAGSGNDVLFGGAGADNIHANEGHNWISAGGGSDQITAGSGNDMISGGGGDDRISANEGANWVDGGAGNDEITAGSGTDRIWAGGGNDVVHANGGDNRVNLGAGNDFLTAGSGNDVIIDGAGDDVVFAGEGNNTFKMGGALGERSDGNDQYTTGSGADRFYIYLHDVNGAQAGFGTDVINGFRLREGDKLVGFSNAGPSTLATPAGFDTLGTIGWVVDNLVTGRRSADGGDLVLTFREGAAPNVNVSEVTLKWFFWQNSFYLDEALTTGYGEALSRDAMLDVLLDLDDMDVFAEGGVGPNDPNFLPAAHAFFDAIFNL